MMMGSTSFHRLLGVRALVTPTVLPTAAMPAMPAPATMPTPATAAPPNLLDLSRANAASEDSGRRLLCDDACQQFGKCHRGGGYRRPTKEERTPHKAQSIDTNCTFQHV